MKTLIIYSTMYGSAKRCAEVIAENCSDAELFEAKKAGGVNIEDYDRVVISASIHAGAFSGKLVKLVRNRELQLLSRPLDFLICCAEEHRISEYMENAFEPVLRDHVRRLVYGGFQFNFSRMNPVVRAVIRKISGLNESVDQLRLDEARTLSDL